MAGLTKAQRAERDAVKQVELQAENTAEILVTMTKDGEELEIHPTCVHAHEAAGWAIKD